MKAYVLAVLVIDHDEIGKDEAVRCIEDARYPNRCIHPSVEVGAELDIGEWHDDHPLNVDPDHARSTVLAVCRQLGDAKP